MGNDPVNYADPNGAYSKFGAWWRNGFSMDGVHPLEGDEWGYYSGNRSDELVFNCGCADGYETSFTNTANDVFGSFIFTQARIADSNLDGFENGVRLLAALADGNGDQIKEQGIKAGITVLGAVGVGKVLGVAAKGAGRVFWSGGGEAMKAAATFAKASGGKTLEMTLGGRAMAILNPVLPRSISKPIWNRLSTNFAKGATGSVNVFHNANGVRLQSIWARTEYGILRSNNVNIFYHNVFP